MHQDQRIGLALAVLLIGAAGAFFFRNDPKPAGSSPRLKTARALDAKIAEKSISPYLQNNDEDHETGTSARKVSDRKAGESGSLPHLDTPDFYTPNDAPADNPLQARSDNDVQELNAIPFPDANSPSSTTAETARPTAASDRIHVVQKGETLSSIAAKELGSSGRFQEIFEANPELHNANDVRVGMSLRIPGQRATRPDSVSQKSKERPKITPPPLLPGDPSRTEIGDATPVDSEKSPRRVASEPSIPKKKFEPAKRVPMGARGLPQSSEAEPAKPRKLSQLPPGDAGGKVAR